MNPLIAAAIARGEASVRKPIKPKRGPKPRPQIEAAYKNAVNLWKKQLTLTEVCQIAGISPNTFRWYFYHKKNKLNQQ